MNNVRMQETIDRIKSESPFYFGDRIIKSEEKIKERKTCKPINWMKFDDWVNEYLNIFVVPSHSIQKSWCQILGCDMKVLQDRVRQNLFTKWPELNENGIKTFYDIQQFLDKEKSKKQIKNNLTDEINTLLDKFISPTSKMKNELSKKYQRSYPDISSAINELVKKKWPELGGESFAPNVLQFLLNEIKKKNKIIKPINTNTEILKHEPTVGELLTDEWIPLRKAADITGKTPEALRKRIYRGEYSQIKKIKGKYGDIWYIHQNELTNAAPKNDRVEWSNGYQNGYDDGYKTGWRAGFYAAKRPEIHNLEGVK